MLKDFRDFIDHFILGEGVVEQCVYEDAVMATAAEAYQVIGALAYEAGMFDEPGVQKALDYFGDMANGEVPTRATDILPWSPYER